MSFDQDWAVFDCQEGGRRNDERGVAYSRLSSSAYPVDGPWQIPRQVQLANGLPNKLNQTLWRATLQPPFSYRDTELNRLIIGPTTMINADGIHDEVEGLS
jgi:hypothetical protein